MTLTEFLLARIAEDESSCGPEDAQGLSFCDAEEGTHYPAARVLAECKAKRRIVELHKDWPVLVETPPEFDNVPDPHDVGSMTMRMSKQIAWTTEQKYREHFGTEPPTGPILRALAAVYADHPDYDQTWRP